jgi:hypothetical protein
MPTAKSQVTTNQVLTTARSEAEQLLAAVFNSLNKIPTPSAAGGPPRLFFPNGIELIYLKVEAYFTDKIHGSVEVQIAGEKGHRPLKVETAANVPALAG